MLYSNDHVWVRVEGNIAIIGITAFVIEGEAIIFDFPEVGQTYNKGNAICIVEFHNDLVEVHTPISGTVKEINEDLEGYRNLFDNDPTGDGWLVMLQMSNTSELNELMNLSAYEAYTASLEE